MQGGSVVLQIKQELKTVEITKLKTKPPKKVRRQHTKENRPFPKRHFLALKVTAGAQSLVS